MNSQKLSADIRDALVSPAAARRDYAVAVSESGALDAAATATLRAPRSAEG